MRPRPRPPAASRTRTDLPAHVRKMKTTLRLRPVDPRAPDDGRRPRWRPLPQNVGKLMRPVGLLSPKERERRNGGSFNQGVNLLEENHTPPPPKESTAAVGPVLGRHVHFGWKLLANEENQQKSPRGRKEAGKTPSEPRTQGFQNEAHGFTAVGGPRAGPVSGAPAIAPRHRTPGRSPRKIPSARPCPIPPDVQLTKAAKDAPPAVCTPRRGRCDQRAVAQVRPMVETAFLSRPPGSRPKPLGGTVQNRTGRSRPFNRESGSTGNRNLRGAGRQGALRNSRGAPRGSAIPHVPKMISFGTKGSRAPSIPLS